MGSPVLREKTFLVVGDFMNKSTIAILTPERKRTSAEDGLACLEFYLDWPGDCAFLLVVCLESHVLVSVLLAMSFDLLSGVTFLA